MSVNNPDFVACNKAFRIDHVRVFRHTSISFCRRTFKVTKKYFHKIFFNRNARLRFQHSVVIPLNVKNRVINTVCKIIFTYKLIKLFHFNKRICFAKIPQQLTQNNLSRGKLAVWRTQIVTIRVILLKNSRLRIKRREINRFCDTDITARDFKIIDIFFNNRTVFDSKVNTRI